MSFNVDSAIFIVFLIATILLGLFSSYGIRNIKEYAIGNRNFSTATIVATLVATWASGQAFFTILSETYSSGLYFIWSVLGYILCLLSIGIFFAPRMNEFLGKLSIADAMGDLYGKQVRIITAIAGFIASGGMIALQLKVSGFLFECCFGIPEIYGIFIGGVIVTIYSSMGGIKSVTYTDVIQLFTFGTMIPALALFILGTLDSVDILTDTITTHELFDYKQVFDFNRPKSIYFIFLFLFNAIPAFNPAFFQRIAMAKSTIQVGRSFVIAAFTCLFIILTISFISLLILSTKPNLDTNDIIKHILFDYSYPGLKGLILAGIMAMVMSTADSYINSSSVLFVHDFCKPLGIKIVKNELIFSRLASALIGIVSIMLALRSGSLLQLIIAANILYMPIVTVPFILALLGFRTSSKSILIGMGAGFVTVVIWELFLRTGDIDALIPGMVVNLIFLVGSHYILGQAGGWVGIKDYAPLKTIRHQRSLRIKNFIYSIKGFNLVKFLRKNSPNDEAVYVYFGVFCIITLYSTIYTLPKEVQLQYPALINCISPSVLFSATALLSYPLWPMTWKEKTLISIIWNIVAFYVLICVGFLFVIINNFAPLQVMILMINLILIAVLVRWQWALFLMIAGFFAIVQFLNFYLAPDILLKHTLSLQLKVIYLLLLVSSILIVFFKPKQEYQTLTEEKNEHLYGRISIQEKQLKEALGLRAEFIRNVSHEYHAPMTGITSMAQTLWESYGKLNDEQRKSAAETIYKSSVSLESFDANISSLSKLSKARYELKLERVDLSELLYNRIEICRKLYERNKEDREFVFNIKKKLIVSCDKYYLTQTIDNLIINAITYCKKGKITITLKKSDDKVHLTITDEGVGIPKTELLDIFAEFIVSSKTKTPAGGRGVGLALCKKVIECHGGSISAESNGIKGSTFILTLPLKD